ncbi:MAG: phenylalanine--tRNA ligase subunit beta [Candidatus Omnitrophica bacterium]|nr:phenylalanine--tRNA ligase subunit beta [Candidatus Omnitrophota bacterium]
MKVTYNWLKDFVDITIPAEALADKLTMAGLEVTGLDKREGDFVLEIEITSNRPDWLSVVGIAREVAAITGKKLKAAKSRQQSEKVKPSGIKIEDKKDCPVYTARIMQGTKVSPAPGWMRKRLELVGCRSTNNIVDSTNYILFTIGEPLHAFDLDKILRSTGNDSYEDLVIGVRRAKDREEIITIDGEKRVLNKEILVITAGKTEEAGRPIAIAGIIGGKDTEVDEGTKNILLEAAIFNPLVTRRARRALGLQTESSYRFERGIDPEAVELASSGASDLIEKCASAKQLVFLRSGTAAIKTSKIILDITLAQEKLGITLGLPKIKDILTRLGFAVSVKNKDKIQVTVPSSRMDVAQEVDLIEELARVNGYGNIAPTLPAANVKAGDYKKDLLAYSKNILVGLGLQEVITYSLVGRDILSGLSQEEPIEILNPLSKDQEVLRTTLTPGLLTCISRNLNQQEGYVAIFEAAKRFAFKEKGVCGEELMLGVALCGARPRFVIDGLIKDKTSILHLKGIAEVLFERLGISDYRLQIGPAQTVCVKVKEDNVGVIFEVQRDILDKWDIKNKEVFILEFSLEKIFSLAGLEKKFKPLPLYPAIVRDTSLVIKEEILVDDILAAVRKNSPL